MEEKTELEIKKLELQKQICIEALKEYSAYHPMKTQRFKNGEIEKLLQRLFDAEVDFLQRNPEDYFEIYHEG